MRESFSSLSISERSQITLRSGTGIPYEMNKSLACKPVIKPSLSKSVAIKTASKVIICCCVIIHSILCLVLLFGGLIVVDGICGINGIVELIAIFRSTFFPCCANAVNLGWGRKNYMSEKKEKKKKKKKRETITEEKQRIHLLLKKDSYYDLIHSKSF